MDQMHMPMSDMPMQMQMQMSFYWGKDAIILFSNWPKDSLGMYILAIFFVFVLAMASELLSNIPALKRGTNPIVGGLSQTIIYAFRISLVYLLMLAIMSFNLGIFIAVVAGHTLGFFIVKYRAIAMADGQQNGISIITQKV